MDYIIKWWKVNIDGCAMFRFSKKLNFVKRNPKKWNKESFGHILIIKVSSLRSWMKSNRKSNRRVYRRIYNYWKTAFSSSYMILLPRKNISGGKGLGLFG